MYRSADRVAARYMTAGEAADFARNILKGLDIIEGALMDAMARGSGWGEGSESLADSNGDVGALVAMLKGIPFDKVRRQVQRTSRGRSAGFLVIRTAMEHPSEEARKKYLSDHPNADPKNHTVSGGSSPKDQGSKPSKPSGPRKTFKPSVSVVVSKHNLKDEDADEIEAFKRNKPDVGKTISDAEKLRRFLQKAKPETRERMKGISPADFAKLLGAIMDEDGVDF